MLPIVVYMKTHIHGVHKLTKWFTNKLMLCGLESITHVSVLTMDKLYVGVDRNKVLIMFQLKSNKYKIHI